MEAEIRRVCGPDSAAGYRTAAALADRALPDRDRPLHRRATSTPRSACSAPISRGWPRSAGSAGSAPRVARYLPDERLQRIFSFQALYAGVPPERALGAYGVIAYMDTVAGVYFPRGGMRAVGPALADAAAAAGAEIHYGRDGDRAASARRPGHRGAAPGHRRARGRHRAAGLRRRRAHAGPAGRATGWSAGAPRRPVPLRWSPSAVVLHAGVARTRPDAAHHTISFGAAWESHVPRDHRRGPADERPVAAGHPADRDRPRLAPAGNDLLFVLAPCPNTARGPDRLGARRPAPTATRCSPCWPARGIPGSTRSRARDRGVAPGHPGRLGGRRDGAPAPRSPWRTRSPRPARSGRATWCAGSTTWCWPAAAPPRASASRRC